MERLKALFGSLFESREHWLERMLEETPPVVDATKFPSS